MQRLAKFSGVAGLVIALAVGLAGVAEAPVIPVEIDVSPNVINLASSGTVVTVHTDLPYGAVIGDSVCLNGVEIYYWKSDDRGYFVAKFHMEDIEALDLDIDAYNTLTLTGECVDGLFAGAQDILVKNNLPRVK